MTAKHSWVPWLFAVVGCVIAWHPTLASGFASMQTDPGDTRFNHYVLEHGYRWLVGRPGHESFWNAPFFHPAENVLAYSDTLLGAAPPYWALRVVGVGEFLSFQLWQIVLGLLNFAVCYRWLRGRFDVGALGASLGAFLFAFSAPRIGQISHIQLHPHWYAIGAIEGTWRLLEGRGGRWAFVAAACVVGQLYAGFYLGWFLAVSFPFALFVGLALGVSRPSWKEAGLGALRHVRASWAACALAVVLAAAMLFPLATHYLEAAGEVGIRGYSAVYAPELPTWFYAGPDNVEGRWLADLPFLSSAPRGLENEIGLGLVTTLCLLCGLFVGLRDRSVPSLLILTGLAWVVLTTLFPYRVHFWRSIIAWVPGAGAVRALSRVGLALAPLAAVGLAVGTDRLVGVARTRRAAIVALGLLVVAVPFEQIRTLPAFERVDAEAPVRELVDEIRARECELFFYVGADRDVPPWQINIDAMWAGLLAGVPTVNGYSGNTPPGWFMKDPSTRGNLTDWIAREGLDLPDDWVID